MGKINIKLKEIIVDKTLDDPEDIRVQIEFVDSNGAHQSFAKTLSGLIPVQTISIDEYVFKKDYPLSGTTPTTGGSSGGDGVPSTVARASATGSMTVTKMAFQTKLTFWGVMLILLGVATGGFLSYLFNGLNLFSMISAGLAGISVATFIARLLKIDINYTTPIIVYFSATLPPAAPLKWYEDGSGHLNQAVALNVPSGTPGYIAGTEVSYTFVFIQE